MYSVGFFFSLITRPVYYKRNIKDFSSTARWREPLGRVTTLLCLSGAGSSSWVTFWFTNLEAPYWLLCDSFFFFKDFILFLFLERGEGREKERERNINVWLPLARPLLRTWPATRACALTGNWTGGPLVRSSVLISLSHTSQGCFMILYVHNYAISE